MNPVNWPPHYYIHQPIHFEGYISPPGSKSTANRVLPLAAVGKGSITLEGLPQGEDVRLMIEALHTLKVDIDQQTPTSCHIRGQGAAFTTSQPIHLHLGNSGTCMRFLSGLLAASQGQYTLDGVQRMRERPLGPLVEALEPLLIPLYKDKNALSFGLTPGFPPLTLSTQGLRAGVTQLDPSLSSQFVTGILLALPLAQGPVTLNLNAEVVSAPYIALTQALMEIWGAPLHKEATGYTCLEPKGYTNPSHYTVEPDPSSASYFLAAAALCGGPVTVKGVGHNCLQWAGEGGFARVLEQMGAQVQINSHTITVQAGVLKGITINMDSMSDTAMTLAVLALFAEGPTVLTHIGNWRHKETDRLAAMACELRKCGAQVTEGEDWLSIQPLSVSPSALHNSMTSHPSPSTHTQAVYSATPLLNDDQYIPIHTYNDHRMAMAFTLAGLGGLPIKILNPSCVEKTYPQYFTDMQGLCKN